MLQKFDNSQLAIIYHMCKLADKLADIHIQSILDQIFDTRVIALTMSLAVISSYLQMTPVEIIIALTSLAFFRKVNHDSPEIAFK